jgi:predicted phosphodiesterase
MRPLTRLPVRIGVLSDIHGNLPALEAVVADMQRRGVDAVVNLGDSLSGPLLPAQTAQYLMAQDWTHLAGNHERQILASESPASASDAYARSQLTPAQLAWIGALQPCADYAPGVLLCHATPHSDLLYLLETIEPARSRLATVAEIESRLGQAQAGLILCGHSHVARMVRTPGRLIVNPGSVGLPGFSAGTPYPHVVENASPDARYAIVERVADAWRPCLFAVPYDAGAMADLAQRRGRTEWSRALRTGYVGA